MPLSAALGFIDEGAEDKAKEIEEIYHYLKGQKGFKWYISGIQRSMYSILAYSIVNMNEDTAVINSVISTTLTNIILEEIILISLLASSTNSANSSGSK